MTRYYLKPTHNGRTVARRISESFDDNPNYRAYQNTIRACNNIIFQTSTKGRSLSERDITPLQSDKRFMELRQEVIEQMEGYFNATKDLLAYMKIRAVQDGETYLVQEADRCLNTEFTPDW